MAGLALVTAGTLGLVWGLVRGNAAGWGGAETVGTLAGGALLMIAFEVRQRRARAPMSITGLGFSIAIPAVTRSVTSTVAPPDMGKAAGVYSTVRQLGGALGVAVHVAVFAAAGGCASAQTFSDGFAGSLAAAAGVALVGALAGAALPRVDYGGRRDRLAPTAPGERLSQP